MSDNNEKTYKIYNRNLQQWFEVSEELYYAYSRPIWKTFKRMKRSNQCTCPKNKLYMCDGDCTECEHYKFNSLSMETSIGENITVGDTIFDSSQDIERNYHKEILIMKLHEEIESLSDIDSQICKLMLQGKKDCEITAMLGFKSQSNIVYRKKVIFKKLKERLSDYI